MPTDSVEEMLEKFLCATVDATSILYKKELYGHLLVIIYSAIDTFGLLAAPPNQVSSTGDSFKNWVKKYIVTPNTNIEFNEIDLWGARCAVLHTFTAGSDLSRKGQAKELVYYGGDPTSQAAKQIDAQVRAMPGGNHLPVHFETLYSAFIQAIRPFISDLENLCTSDANAKERLKNVLQIYRI